ncbi:MAG: patatin-like phospholipase family protein [Smithellaceae bacterium]
MTWYGKKVGLALGGGGVRGLAHIGVIKVLEQEGIDIDLIAGTSAGALIGAAYACGLTPKEISARVDAYLASAAFADSTLKSLGESFSPRPKNFLQKTQAYIQNRYWLTRAFLSPGIVPTGDFQSLIESLLPDIDIRQTQIPFFAVSTDLITGSQVVFSEGSLRQAVLASSSVPGAAEPVRIGQWLLADGGVVSLVPVHAARNAGADTVIAVMVDRDLPPDARIETATDVLYRAGEITANALQAEELKDADVVIQPALGTTHWSDFSRSKDLVKIGEAAAREALTRIHACLPVSRKIARFAGRLFSKEKSQPEGRPGPIDC